MTAFEQPLYKIGYKVWMMHKNQVIKVEIRDIYSEKHRPNKKKDTMRFLYGVYEVGASISEESLFESKQTLIDSL